MPRHPALTPEQLSTLARMSHTGCTRAEIARAIGVSGATVTRRLGAVRAYKGKRVNVPATQPEVSNANIGTGEVDNGIDQTQPA